VENLYFERKDLLIMKSVSSKLLIPVILLFIPSIMLYIRSENKGLEFIFDNIMLIIGWLSIVAVYIFIRQREKTGKISEQQIMKAKQFYSKNDKKRMTVFFICILIAAIIYVVFNWYYSIPLFIIAIIIYIPILKKIYYGDKTNDNEKND
jgi:divalent metal cation (Fe/Co/Zn/Cd) transporter